MDFFGDTSIGIVILDFILVGLGAILTPILWGILKGIKEGLEYGKDIKENGKEVIKRFDKINGSISTVLEHVHSAEIRDEAIKGYLTGVTKTLERIEQKN